MDAEISKIRNSLSSSSTKENISNVQQRSITDASSSKIGSKMSRKKSKKALKKETNGSKFDTVFVDSRQKQSLNVLMEDKRENSTTLLRETWQQTSDTKVSKNKKTKSKSKISQNILHRFDSRSDSHGEGSDQFEDIIRDLEQSEERDPPPPIETTLDFDFKGLRITCSTPSNSEIFQSYLPPPIIPEKERNIDVKQSNSGIAKKYKAKCNEKNDVSRRRSEQKIVTKTRSREGKQELNEIIEEASKDKSEQIRVKTSSSTEEKSGFCESNENNLKQPDVQRKLPEKKISLESVFESIPSLSDDPTEIELNKFRLKDSLEFEENEDMQSQESVRQSRIQWSQSIVSKECKKPTSAKYPRRLSKKEKTKLFTTRPDLDIKTKKRTNLDFMDDPMFAEDFQETQYMCGLSSVFLKHGFNPGFSSISDTTKKHTSQVNEMISNYLTERTSCLASPSPTSSSSSPSSGTGDSFVHKFTNYMSQNPCTPKHETK